MSADDLGALATPRDEAGAFGHPVRAAILHATAATLRTVAGWGAESDDLYQVAGQVEALLEPADEADSLRDVCCPVCEEVDCDDSCPLAPVRQDRINRT